MISSRIETDTKKCQLLWQEFSPKKLLFDLWDFWSAFYTVYRHQPYFIVLQENNKSVGLLPLWYEKEKKKYYWFGGLWQDGISFWVKKPAYILHFLSLCPKDTFLNGIAIEEKIAQEIKKFVSTCKKSDFGPDDPKYILDLIGIKSFDDYLAGLKKDRRKSIKKDLLLIEKQNPEIIFDNFQDFQYLIEFNKSRFKNEVVQNDPWRYVGWRDKREVEAFLNIIQSKQKEFQPRMITVRINKKIAGVDFVVVSRGCYYTFVCGYDVNNFPGIGNYFNMLDIKDALKLGFKKIDSLQGDYGWKHRWYKEAPLYYFTKE